MRDKVNDSGLIKRYRKDFPHCEACLYLDGSYPVYEIETHHIHGGNDRTDEIWNIINVCHEHHERATTHNLKHGPGSKEWNEKYLAIKTIKKEIVLSKMYEMKVNADAVYDHVDIILRSAAFKMGCRLGWIDLAN